jgi:TonB-dependent receptor
VTKKVQKNSCREHYSFGVIENMAHKGWAFINLFILYILGNVVNFDLRLGVPLATFLSASVGVSAQPGEQPAEDLAKNTFTYDEVLVVTGFRKANSEAIADKLSSFRVTDGINQDTVGLLPDLTVADIASRIPGLTSVSSTGVGGPRSKADAEQVVIRGLSPDFNLTTFDGAPIASVSESNRAANLSLFPPAIVSRVEAIKTISADMNPHALSGQLNLKTASAFNENGLFSDVRFSIGDNSTSGNVVSDQGENVRATGLFGNTFNNDEFGFVISGSYEEFYSTTRDVRPGGQENTYLFYTDDVTNNDFVDVFAESNGFPAPRRNQIYLYENEKERASLAGKFEWRPSDMTYASVFAGWFTEDEQEVRHEHLVVANQGLRPVNQTVNTGDWLEARLEAGFVYQPRETTTQVVTARLDHDFDEKQGLDITASLSSAEVDIIRNMSKFNGSNSTSAAFSYDQSGGNPILDFADPAFVNDVSSIPNAYIRERTQKMKQDLAFFDGAWKFNYEDSDSGFGVKVGASLLSTDQEFDREYIEGDVFNIVGCTEVDITDCPRVTFDQFIEDSVFPTTDPDVSFYLVDDAALRAAWLDQGQPITNDRTDNSINSDYTLNESIMGLYAQSVYRADRFTVHAGLRTMLPTLMAIFLFATDGYLATQIQHSMFPRSEATNMMSGCHR